MNKETRKFIWYLLLTVVCGVATALHIAGIIYGIWDNEIYNYILFIICILGTIYGVFKINESI